MNGKRILVTGGSGFIGACFARRIADSCDVHLILRKGSDRWRVEDVLGNVTIHEGDVTDREGLGRIVETVRPQMIYHFAAYGASHGQKDAGMLVDANLKGTINLVDACAETGFEFFANVGSSSEYGVKGKPMREDDMLEPDSVYGITKAAATQYCQHIAKARKLPISTFRIFAAYGQYQPPGWLISTLVIAALKRQPPRLASPLSVRDFIFVEDIVDALVLAGETKAAHGEILNIGTGRQHTVAEVASIVAGLCGTDAEPEWGAEGSNDNEPESWVADMSKTARLLGWTPKHDIKSGLARTIDWFRDNISRYGGSA